MLGLKFHFEIGNGVSPVFTPGEEILFERENVWYFTHECLPWQFGEICPIPLLVNIGFFVTTKRAITVLHHCSIFVVEISQWYPGVEEQKASEFIADVSMGKRHFGSVKFDFFGLGRKTVGISPTRFGATGKEIPYLEIRSKAPRKEKRVRRIQLFLGDRQEDEEALGTVHRILVEKLNLHPPL